MVHETSYNPCNVGGWEGDEIERVSYLWVELIDLLNGNLDIPRMNCSTNVNSFLNRLDICSGLDVGL